MVLHHDDEIANHDDYSPSPSDPADEEDDWVTVETTQV